jgi:hypothetical protein
VALAGGGLAVAFGGLCMAFLTYWLNGSMQSAAAADRRVAISEEIERRHTPNPCTRADDAVATAALLPLALRGPWAERRAALLALVLVDPARVIAISPALQATATDDDQRSFIRSVTLDASERHIMDCFLDQLEFAREFLRRGLHERACAEYARAWNLLPDRFGSRVDPGAFERGLSLCALGKHAEGTREFQRVFSRVTPSR